MTGSRAAAGALAVVALLASGWLAYDRGWGRGGDRPLAWRDVTAALAPASFPRASERVFESRAELARFLELAMPRRTPRPPPVDFARRTVLLVTTGPRSSSGYSIDVLEVREERRRVVVLLRERTPRLGERVRPRVTHPFRLLTIPRVDKRVDFVWEGR